MIEINQRDETPIFQQIVDQIGQLITLGVLQKDDKLPSVRSMAKDLGINPNTVARAYRECEVQKLIYSIPNRGFFVEGSQKGVSNFIQDAYLELEASFHRLQNLGESKEAIIHYLKENCHD